MKKFFVILTVVMTAVVVYPQESTSAGLGLNMSSYTLKQVGLPDIQSDLAPSVFIFFEGVGYNSFKGKVMVEYTPLIYTRKNEFIAKMPNTFSFSMMVGWKFLETGLKVSWSPEHTFENENAWIRRAGQGRFAWAIGVSQEIMSGVRIVAHYCHEIDGYKNCSFREQELKINSINLGLSFDMISL